MVLGMLLADGRFPAGTYAHSLGLEQAVSDGLDAGEVPGFIGARLRLVAEPEARLRWPRAARLTRAERRRWPRRGRMGGAVPEPGAPRERSPARGGAAAHRPRSRCRRR